MFGELKKVKAEFDAATQLTAMANVFEAIERTRHTHHIGAGGGIDSLPRGDQQNAVAILQKGMTKLAKVPPNVVTRELIKNMQVANGFGRADRVSGMARLLDFLVEKQLAQPLDSFLAENSY
ncbi:MAG: hypothetical protein EON58_05280 [Alphaproteobacteria bacterium]|nr:MAG: hypothetical protein EON58_05280 [Alphaproteobacteria bacterium]